jgi:putative aminopeptidase FrvX
MFDLVKRLCDLHGPTGMEDPVQAAVHELWVAQSERLWTTAIGNLHAQVGGRGPKLLLGAHADEICLLVRAITDDGFLWLSTGQGEQTNAMPNPLAVGQPVVVLGRDGAVPGILARASGHVRTEEERQRDRLGWEEIFVDLGLPSRAAVASTGIGVGAPVIFDAATRRLGELVVGKAMDDRAALAIMTEVARRVDRSSLRYELHLVSTVQEEVGLLGAASAAAGAGFAGAIALDVGLVADIPSVPHERFPARLGGGPVLGYKDVSYHYDRKILGRLQRVAEQRGIPTQPLVFSRYSSDGVEFSRSGVPTALVAYPTRYTHSPFEMVHLRDLEQTVDLLLAYLTSGEDA